MSRGRKKWLVAGGVLAIIVLVVVLLLQHLMNSSTEGMVSISAPGDSQTSKPTPLQVKTAYFTTELPIGFQVKRRTETPANPLDLVSIFTVGGTNKSDVFTVTMGDMPANGLAGNGDYILRTTQTDTYRPYTPPGMPRGATTFRTTAAPYSFVVFWPHAGTVAEIALRSDGGDSLEALDTIFQHAIANWQWLQ